MATIKRIGFGQVEPNHLSAQRTAQIYAQLPAADGIDILENGQFVKYDLAKKEVNFTGKGEWMLVFNEIKLYDERQQRYKDYAMKREDFTPDGSKVKNGIFVNDVEQEGISHDGLSLDGQMVPRVFKTNIGDHYTTNTIGGANTSNIAEYEYSTDIEIDDILTPNATTGYLEKNTSPNNGDMQWQVVKIYTMPDGQIGVKVLRIA